MTVSSYNFLESAKSIAESSCEISARNSISRAYYAVYHESLSIANDMFPDPNAHLSMGEHVRIKERYLSWDAFPKHKSVGYILQAMKLERHLADYNISGVTITQQKALTQIENADRLIELLAAGKFELQSKS